MPPEDFGAAKAAQTYAFTVNGVGYRTADPVVTGRDILRIAGFTPVSDYVLIQLLRPGTRSIGLDNDQINLSDEGKENFRAWASDRVYNLTIDDIGNEWGAPSIGETDLRDITGIDDDKDFMLELQDAPDRLVTDDAPVDLAKRGAESVRSVRAAITIFVNTEPHQVAGRTISFEALVQLGFETPPTGENILITVEYGKGPKENPKGSLKAGQSVKIKNGMEFDVVATDRS